MLVKDESLKEYLSYHQQCLYTIQYLLKEMTNEDGSKCFDEMEGNYFDPFVPYFENKVKKKKKDLKVIRNCVIIYER